MDENKNNRFQWFWKNLYKPINEDIKILIQQYLEEEIKKLLI